jgi:nonribosomal peptide synthetase protein VioO
MWQSPSGILAGFLAMAEADPDRPALAGNGVSYSYGQLAGEVEAVAQRLGPRPGVVAVDATHSVATITILLGIWRAGGTYCPIDPAYPAERRRGMLAAAASSEGDPAYVLFTSGSSGTPKPVATSHRAIAVTVVALRDLFAITPADRVLQFASLNWDTCFEEILPTLTAGACLVLDDDAYRGSFPHLLRLVEREQVSVLDLPTAFWHELVHHLDDGGVQLPSCVRLVIIGGEAANPERVRRWSELGRGARNEPRSLRAVHGGQAVTPVRLLNTYGCTETTLITHAVDLTGWCGEGPVPIGRPLPHVVEHVTGEGELWIGGPAIADGYPGRASDRFTTLDGERYFATGDRVSRMPDGNLVHQGRLDAQLKIRGIRVDPGEVEAHIASHPAVGAVAVTGVGVADHTVLAAFVVSRGPAEGLPASIVEHLRGRVPAHLIPTRIRVVSDLFYTATGKVDRTRTKEAFA